MKYLLTTALLLSLSANVAQELQDVRVFVSDFTVDDRVLSKDTIIVHLAGIFRLIEREEWDRSKIDLALNDISFAEVTPQRISRKVTIDGNEVDIDLLGFIVQKGTIPDERFDDLRTLKVESKVYLSLKLPNDSEINKVVLLNSLGEGKVYGGLDRKAWAWVLSLLVGIFLIVVAFWKNLLRDKSIAAKKPYSFSRVQIAWWTVIVISSILFTWISTGEFTINSTVWILLGISAGTLGVSSAIDVKDLANANAALGSQPNAVAQMSQNHDCEGFFKDILSDKDGISIHRLQSFVFNVSFGIFYLIQAFDIYELPVFDNNVLGLLGLSNGAYTLLKNSENK